MARAMSEQGWWLPARRKTDLVLPEPCTTLDPDEALARLRRLMNQLHLFAEHWDVPAGCEVHVDLRLAMSMARWPSHMRH